MQRKAEYFDTYELSTKQCIFKSGLHLYPQERDWTCSIACIRTLLSTGNKELSEQYYIDKFGLKPGPHFSRDIKRIGILAEYDVKYGCDSKDICFDDILDTLNQGYGIMLECMYSYSHWLVLLGFIPIDDCNVEKSQLVLYDPYYDQLKVVIVDEFISMWYDGNYEVTQVKNDFIAIKV